MRADDRLKLLRAAGRVARGRHRGACVALVLLALVLLLRGCRAAGVARVLAGVLREKCSAGQQRQSESGDHDLLHFGEISL